MKDALGYYEVLQIPSDADIETIKRAYRDMAKIWHPDNNLNKDTTEIFQKISMGYNVLSDAQTRLEYDILSLVYTKNNYPDINAIAPYTDEDNGVDVKVIKLKEMISMFVNYKQNNICEVTTYAKALKINFKVSVINWLLGWWHPKGALMNVKAIINNYNNPIDKAETLKIMLHNMIAYNRKSHYIDSAKCASIAKTMLSDSEKELVDKYISNQNIKVSSPKKWSEFNLKALQTIIPVTAVFLFFYFFGSWDHKILSFFNNDDKIIYYQTVDTGYGKSVDDVVVGRVISIPIDKSDKQQLYHITEEAKVMYGPSEDFDMIKLLSEGTTVRLTGFTPDKIWARIMIDNGELGFIKYDNIKQGMGNDIPYGSSIIE